MAISLSNHEDRIKKLESGGSGYVINLLGTKAGQLSDSIQNYKAILVEITQDYGGVTPLFLDRSSISIGKVYGVDGVNANRCSFKFTSNTNVSLVTNHYYKGISRIIGLKLYYNFSYNIYSLANSISFHFFKCLINSFKGGVKEIWQLV